MLIVGSVLGTKVREGNDGKRFHSVRVADDTLKQNEGVIAVDVTEEQASKLGRGARVSIPISFVNTRSWTNPEGGQESFVTYAAPKEWEPEGVA